MPRLTFQVSLPQDLTHILYSVYSPVGWDGFALFALACPLGLTVLYLFKFCKTRSCTKQVSVQPNSDDMYENTKKSVSRCFFSFYLLGDLGFSVSLFSCAKYDQRFSHKKNSWLASKNIYVLVIEGTEPASVLQRYDSPNLSPFCLQYTQLPDSLTEQAGRGWVSHIFLRRWPVLSLLSLIYEYILWLAMSNFGEKSRIKQVRLHRKSKRKISAFERRQF